MRFKSYPIQIWFLDDDLQLSAKCLIDRFLEKSVNGCIDALVSSIFYANGIRTKKFYSYFFGKEKKDETMEKLFPNWPLNRRPSFDKYNTRTSKWCRKCNEHYQLVLRYLGILLAEYEFRHQKNLDQQSILEWFVFDAPELKIPNANLKNDIVIPWKVIDPVYRRKDIIAGYRAKYMSMFDNWNAALNEYSMSNVVVPKFVKEYFQLDIN